MGNKSNNVITNYYNGINVIYLRNTNNIERMDDLYKVLNEIARSNESSLIDTCGYKLVFERLCIDKLPKNSIVMCDAHSIPNYTKYLYVLDLVKKSDSCIVYCGTESKGLIDYVNNDGDVVVTHIASFIDSVRNIVSGEHGHTVECDDSQTAAVMKHPIKYKTIADIVDIKNNNNIRNVIKDTVKELYLKITLSDNTVIDYNDLTANIRRHKILMKYLVVNENNKDFDNNMKCTNLSANHTTAIYDYNTANHTMAILDYNTMSIKILQDVIMYVKKHGWFNDNIIDLLPGNFKIPIDEIKSEHIHS